MGYSQQGWIEVKFMDLHKLYQGNLKGEYVVAAILLSRMEMSSFTSTRFHSKAQQEILLSMSYLSYSESSKSGGTAPRLHM